MEPTSLSEAFVEAYNQRDVDVIRSLLDPDVVYVRPGPRLVGGVKAIALVGKGHRTIRDVGGGDA